MQVETASPQLGGLTMFRPDPAGIHEVALEVDPERFFKAYFEPFEKLTIREGRVPAAAGRGRKAREG